MICETVVVTDRPIVLVGFMATGKSKIGRLLAERLGLPFVDSDAEIEATLGKSIVRIFAEDGEAEFRRVERIVITRLLEGVPQLIAIGGGAFIDDRTREALKARATTIWLDPPFAIIASRLKRSHERPLASGKIDEELLALWQERRPFYAEAHIRIETTEEEPGVDVDRILAALRQN